MRRTWSRGMPVVRLLRSMRSEVPSARKNVEPRLPTTCWASRASRSSWVM